MRQFLRDNGLSVALLSLFALSWLGQSITGWHVYNKNRSEHHARPIPYDAYLCSAHFAEATFENWESEFLGLGCVVYFSVWLRQKGSPDSKSFREPLGPTDLEKPTGPVSASSLGRDQGLKRTLYNHSLTLALFGLFLACFTVHALSSVRKANEQARDHGGPTVPLAAHLVSAEFWFESLQNWQSEFLSEGAVIVLAIYLRQKGSPQSKPVDAPDQLTGGG